MLDAERLGEFFDRIRRKGIHSAVARCVGFARSFYDCRRGVELGHHAIEFVRFVHQHAFNLRIEEPATPQLVAATNSSADCADDTDVIPFYISVTSAASADRSSETRRNQHTSILYSRSSILVPPCSITR